MEASNRSFPRLRAGEIRHAGRTRLVEFADEGRRGFAAEVQAGYLDDEIDIRNRDALTHLFAAAPAYARAWAMVPEDIRERILAAADPWVADTIDAIAKATWVKP